MHGVRGRKERDMVIYIGRGREKETEFDVGWYTVYVVLYNIIILI